MKKQYIRPSLICEEFQATEYIAACGDSGVVYNFKCNAGSKQSSYHVFLNGSDGKMNTSDDIDWSGRKGYLSPYHPCGATHEAEADSDFQKGYMYKLDRRNNITGNPIEVIVWTNNKTNTHCTTELDMSKWETAKS